MKPRGGWVLAVVAMGLLGLAAASVVAQGSGMAVISDSSMRAKPSMEEPSKPMPSSRALITSS